MTGKWLPPEQQLKELQRGTAEIVSEEELLQKLQLSVREKRPLRVKYGADPTAPDIHLGHTVPIRKLKQFQDLGHEVIFIIGDFTGRIGDPSGRSETRRQLTETEVQENARTYQEQIFKILDPARTRLVFNSSWLAPLNFVDVIHLSAKYTVARMLEREDFKTRLKDGLPISIHELLYPLAQGYDSVAVEADVELGGTDQKFNFLVARDLQREYGQQPQVALMMPLLVGTDGVQKMSKSLNNYIGIDEAPGEIYGKVMSISDEMMLPYFELTTDLAVEEITALRAGLRDGTAHPRDVKMRLARELVALYHGWPAAKKAEQEFIAVFRQGGLPEEIPQVEISAQRLRAVSLLVQTGLVSSNSEAKRMIKQGAVRVGEERISDPDAELELEDGLVIRVGKRRIVRIALRR
ncbi:MAG TPA: tyrosine--tRNA ligase [Firmicutes bacterium]|nr:tyrosine--tRNA ligase [Bacillota bacterium]